MKLFRHLRHYISGKPKNVPGQLNDDRLIRYLLGGLRGKEIASLEQQYFLDDDQFEYLHAIEDELIDRYLRGDLSARDNRRFESHFLASPLRRERVQSAKALMQAVAPVPLRARRSSFWDIHWQAIAWACGCVALVFAVGFSWLIWENAGLQDQLAAARRSLEHLEGNVPSRPLAVSFVLAPVQRDLSDHNRLIVPPEAQILNFSVDLPTAAQPPYRAIFRTADGDQVGTFTDIAAQPLPIGISATIKIPSFVLSPGTYILTLQASRPGSGFEDIKSYSFTLARR